MFRTTALTALTPQTPKPYRPKPRVAEVTPLRAPCGRQSAPLKAAFWVWALNHQKSPKTLGSKSLKIPSLELSKARSYSRPPPLPKATHTHTPRVLESMKILEL